jgi:hypothetical protein
MRRSCLARRRAAKGAALTAPRSAQIGEPLVGSGRAAHGLADHRHGIVLVVDPLRRLDAVQELLIADRVREMRERLGDGQGAGRIAAGHLLQPRVRPDAGGTGSYVLGKEVVHAQRVQDRVAPVRVGEVDDHRRPAVAAPVAGVEVAVHDRVRQSALVEQPPTVRQLPCHVQLMGGQLAGDRAVEQLPDPLGEDGRTTVRQARGPFLRPDGEGRLRRDEAPHSGGGGVRRRLPAVLAGDVLHQDAPAGGGEDGRDQPRIDAGERGDDLRLVRGEVRSGLEPDRAPVGRQPEEPGQVPGAALLHRPGHRPPRRGQRARRPVEQFPEPVDPRPGSPQRIESVQQPWIRRELEQHARTLQRLDVVRHMAVAPALPAVHGQQADHQHPYPERLLQSPDDRLDLGPPRHVDGEGADGAEEVLTRRHPRTESSAHRDSVSEPPRPRPANIAGVPRMADGTGRGWRTAPDGMAEGTVRLTCR